MNREHYAKITEIDDRYKKACESIENLRECLFWINWETQIFDKDTSDMSAQELLNCANNIVKVKNLLTGKTYIEGPI